MRTWRGYADLALFHMGSLAPNQLALVTNGFARALVPDKNLFQRVAERTVDQLDRFEPRDLALLLNGFAKMAFRDPSLFGAISKSIQLGGPEGFEEQQLSLVVNAYARLQIHDEALFTSLSSWISQKSEYFTLQGTAMVANGYSKLTMPDATIIDVLSQKVSAHEGPFKSQDLANLLNASARMRVVNASVEKLLGVVPSQVRDLSVAELVMVVHSAAKLNGATRLSNIFASSIRDRAEEFRSKHLAICLLALSSMKVDASFFDDMAPRVLRNMDAADDHSTVNLFSAYARTQANEDVVRALVLRLQSNLTSLDVQPLVNVFYACGRFLRGGTEKFTDREVELDIKQLTREVVELLVPNVRVMTTVNVVNCVHAISKINMPDRANVLLTPLQSRILNDDLHVQHFSDLFHSLATIYNNSGQSPPRALIPSLIKRALLCEWEDDAQLLTSIAVSCVRLGHVNFDLFSLASTSAQKYGGLSNPGIVDFMKSMVMSHFCDVDLFSSVLSRAETWDASHFGLLLELLGVLDYANHVFSSPSHDAAQKETGAKSMLFPFFPEAFQERACSFFRHTGLAFLSRSDRLPPHMLPHVALPFARAQFLATPWDLLSEESRSRFIVESRAPPSSPDLRRQEPGESHMCTVSVLDCLLTELRRDPNASGQVCRLSLYTSLVNYGAGMSVSVPVRILDTLLHCMAATFADCSSQLPFRDIVDGIALLVDAGVCPQSTVSILTTLAEKCFPDSLGELQAVSDLCQSLSLIGPLTPTFRAKVAAYVLTVDPSETEFDRPLRVCACLLMTLEDSRAHDVILHLASRSLRATNDRQEFDDVVSLFEDVSSLFVSVLRLNRSSTVSEETASSCAALLQGIVLQRVEGPALVSVFPRLIHASAAAPSDLCVALSSSLANHLVQLHLKPRMLAACLKGFARLLTFRCVSGDAFEPLLQVTLARAALMYSPESIHAAHFCVLVLRALSLDSADNVSCVEGLTVLLKRVGQNWTPEEHQVMIAVATIIRSDLVHLGVTLPSLDHLRWCDGRQPYHHFTVLAVTP